MIGSVRNRVGGVRNGRGGRGEDKDLDGMRFDVVVKCVGGNGELWGWV